MATNPLYLDKTLGSSGIKQLGAPGGETEISVQGIEPLTVGSAVDLFSNLTAALTIGGHASVGDIRIGPSGGANILVNQGTDTITLDADVAITGTETVSDTATFTGNVNIGNNAAVDTLTVEAISQFNGAVTLGESGDEVNFNLTYANINSNVSFAGAAPYAIVNDTGNLTLQTTTSGNVAVSAASTVDIDAVANVTINAGVAGNVNIQTGALYVDAATGRVVANGATPQPVGNAAQLSLLTTSADVPVLALKSGGASATAMLTGSSDPSAGLGVAAPVGSLYLNTTGILYLKIGAGDTAWDFMAVSAGSALQNAYNAGPTITMSDSIGDMVIYTDDTGAVADFSIQNQAGTAAFLATDTANTELELGAATISVAVAGVVSSNVTMDTASGSKSITSNGSNSLTVNASAANLLLTTTASGNVAINPAANFVVDTNAIFYNQAASQVGINQTTFNTGASLAATGSADGDVLELNGGATPVSFMVGTTDPSGGAGIAADQGSVFHRLNAAVGELWLKTGAANTAWNQVATGDVTETLQEAYDNSASPATITMATNKNLVFKTNETGGSEADFILEQSGGADYLVADASADQLILGAATVTVAYLGDVASSITFDGSSRSIINDGAGNLTLNQMGTGDLILTSAAGVVQVASGALDIDTSIDFDGTAVDVLASGAISLDGGAASNFSVDSDNLTVSTTTSGTLAISSAGTLDVGGVGIDIDGTAASAFTVTGAGAGVEAITLNTVTNGDIRIDAAEDITFDARAATAPLTYNDAVNVDLDDSTYPFFVGVSSLVGAFNTLAGEIQTGDVISSFTTAEAVSKGDLLYMTTSGTVGKADADTAAKIRPIGVANAGAAPAAVVEVVTAGEVIVNTIISVGDEGKYLFMDKTTTGGVTTDVSGYVAGDVVLRAGVASVSGAAGTATMIISFGEPTVVA